MLSAAYRCGGGDGDAGGGESEVCVGAHGAALPRGVFAGERAEPAAGPDNFEWAGFAVWVCELFQGGAELGRAASDLARDAAVVVMGRSGVCGGVWAGVE